MFVTLSRVVVGHSSRIRVDPRVRSSVNVSFVVRVVECGQVACAGVCLRWKCEHGAREGQSRGTAGQE